VAEERRIEPPSAPRVRHGQQKRDWWQTVRQSIPIALRVARHMAPTYEVGSAADLDVTFLEEHGIRGVLWDVDGTLTHYHAGALAPEAAPVRSLFEHTDLRHAIVSNCDEVRFAELGRIFPDLPILKLYETAGGTVGRRLERGRETWFDGAVGPGSPDPPTAEIVAVRKPDERIIHFAVRQLDLPPEAVLMVGDQFWTDVAGARMAGVRSAKVATAGRSTFPATLRLFQAIEGWVRRALA
jgi:predicted HAD superfamily phosphohydrolase YqeG